MVEGEQKRGAITRRRALRDIGAAGLGIGVAGSGIDGLLARAAAAAPYAHFLAPPGGGTLLELFCDAEHPPPDHWAVDPMHGHLAFAVEDVEADAARLAAAGGVAEGGVRRSPAGDAYAIVRDPWGVPLQLIARSVPFEQPASGGEHH